MTFIFMDFWLILALGKSVKKNTTNTLTVEQVRLRTVFYFFIIISIYRYFQYRN